MLDRRLDERRLVPVVELAVADPGDASGCVRAEASLGRLDLVGRAVDRLGDLDGVVRKVHVVPAELILPRFDGHSDYAAKRFIRIFNSNSIGLT
jgi:hypothetical protein